MKKIILLVIVLFLCAKNVFCQQVIYNYGLYNPHTYSYGQDSNENEVIFYFYQYESETLNMEQFRVLNPQSKNNLSAKVTIQEPIIFNKFKNLVYAVAFLKECINCDSGKTVIILIGDYLSPKPIYFIDSNMDGNYENDGVPFTFANNEKSKKIKLEDKKGNQYAFWMNNPESQTDVPRRDLLNNASTQEKELEEKVVVRKNFKEKTLEGYKPFHIGLDLIIGSGELKYNYIKISDNFPTNYRVTFNSKGVSMNIGYTFKGFQLSAVGSYENIYYWTSYKEIQYDTPRRVDGILLPFRTLMINTDEHPRSRLSYGLSLGYNIKIGNTIKVLPFYNYSAFTYPNNNYYVPSKSYDRNPSFLENRYWQSFGLVVNARVNNSSTFYVKSQYLLPKFNPKSYFESVELKDLEIKYNQLNFGIGYQYHF